MKKLLVLEIVQTKKMAFVKMDYLKGLFRQLSEEEKKFFMNWCKTEIGLGKYWYLVYSLVL